MLQLFQIHGSKFCFAGAQAKVPANAFEKIAKKPFTYILTLYGIVEPTMENIGQINWRVGRIAAESNMLAYLTHIFLNE